MPLALRPLDPWCGMVVDCEEDGERLARIFVDATDVRKPRVKRADAVVVTHPHRDHYGGVPRTDPGRVYADEVTLSLLELAGVDPARLERVKGQFSVGPVIIETFEVNHAVPEARAILLEAAGTRILITGDWCALGEHPPPWERVDEVDVVVTEFTRATAVHPDDLETARARLRRLLELHLGERVVLLLNPVNPLVRAAAEVETVHVLRGDDHAVNVIQRAGAHPGADVTLTDRPEYPLLLSDPRLVEELPRRPKVVITERWFLYRDPGRLQRLERSVPYYYVVSETGHATGAEIRRLIEELRPRHVILRHGPKTPRGESVRTLLRPPGREGTDVQVWIGRRGGKLTV